MKLFTTVLLLLLSTLLHAQRSCVAPISGVTPSFHITDAVAGTAGSLSNTVIRIPVVVHVLYQTEAQNLSAAQIQSGIEALNRDFRRRNSDTINTPQRFKHLAADIEIEFVLATADPSGRATTGIIRKQTTVKEWASDDKIKFSKNGGDDAWDASAYLNIWIGNLPRSLGYATAPGSDATIDGIVITTSAFGTIGKTGAYNMGRTLVHETGHWLGLKHIWGDAACGDDGVDDTPKQSGFTSGCPSGFISSCNNGTQGDMYMNYMDFTNDACMNLFTLGQKAAMRSQFATGGARAAMLQSKGLSAPWNNEPPVVTTPEIKATEQSVIKVKAYPNPATTFITINMGDKTFVDGTAMVMDVNGKPLMQLPINGALLRINVQSLQAGMYVIQLKKDAVVWSGKFVKALP